MTLKLMPCSLRRSMSVELENAAAGVNTPPLVWWLVYDASKQTSTNYYIHVLWSSSVSLECTAVRLTWLVFCRPLRAHRRRTVSECATSRYNQALKQQRKQYTWKTSICSSSTIGKSNSTAAVVLYLIRSPRWLWFVWAARCVARVCRQASCWSRGRGIGTQTWSHSSVWVNRIVNNNTNRQSN